MARLANIPRGATGYEEWLSAYYPDDFSKPLAYFHHEFWSWLDKIELGVYQEPFVQAWSRGLGKSSSLEAAIALLAEKGTRTYCLYVSKTQEQATQHVLDIEVKLLQGGFHPRVTEDGERGIWKRMQLQLNNFSVAGYGIKGAIRGIKDAHRRPDLIIFDDVDEDTDTPEIVRGKIDFITRKILPAGSTDCIVCFLQNPIHEGSVMNQLLRGKAEFLTDRERYEPVPALLKYTSEVRARSNGLNYMHLTSGTPSWPEGMDLNVCQQFVHKFGWDAFLSECQHELTKQGGYFFDTSWWSDKNPRKKIIAVEDVPTGLPVCLGCDLAATQGGGDYTVFTTYAMNEVGVAYVLDVIRGQWSSDKVEAILMDLATKIRNKYPNRYVIRVPQDPAQAGVFQKMYLGKKMAGFNVVFESPTGSKGKRAKNYASRVNIGNVYLVEGAWNDDFILEHRMFRDEVGYKGQDGCIDSCLIAGTLITTQRGHIPIESVTPSDRVLTREGFKRVLWSGMTDPCAQIYKVTAVGSSIKGTAAHPVWIDGGFSAIRSLPTHGMMIIECSTRYQNAKSSTEGSSSGVTQKRKGRRIGATTRRERVTALRGGTRFIGKSTKTITGLSQRECMFTTRIGIPRITTHRTLNSRLSQSILRSMNQSGQRITPLKNAWTIWHQSGHLPSHGTSQKRGRSGTRITVGARLQEGSSENSHACRAERCSCLGCMDRSGRTEGVFVPGIAVQSSDAKREDRRLRRHARTVEQRGWRIPELRYVETAVTVVSETERQAVYNLTVEDCPEFFANGILVHNCTDADSQLERNILGDVLDRWEPESEQNNNGISVEGIAVDFGLVSQDTDVGPMDPWQIIQASKAMRDSRYAGYEVYE